MRDCNVNARAGIVDPDPAASVEFERDMQCLPAVHSIVLSYYTVFALDFDTGPDGPTL